MLLQPARFAVRNLLLRALSPQDFGVLQPHLESVALNRGDGLIQPLEPDRARLVSGSDRAYGALEWGYNIEERLAGWLLMCRDRLDSDDLPLTHEFLSIMLGVRRSSVTLAIQILEGAKIIRTRRGLLTVVNRAKLEEVAGDSYGLPEAEYARLMARAGDGQDGIDGDWRTPAEPSAS